jgi:hypothetical protein
MVCVAGIVVAHPEGNDVARVVSYDFATDTYDVVYPGGEVRPYAGQYTLRVDQIRGTRLVLAVARGNSYYASAYESVRVCR